MVAGLIPADAGSLAVVGEAMAPAFARPKGRIGLVPQELAIYPDLSAREKPAVLRTPPGREPFSSSKQFLRPRTLRSFESPHAVVGLSVGPKVTPAGWGRGPGSDADRVMIVGQGNRMRIFSAMDPWVSEVRPVPSSQSPISWPVLRHA